MEDGRQGGGSSWRALSAEPDRQHKGSPSDKAHSLQPSSWRATLNTGLCSAFHQTGMSAMYVAITDVRRPVTLRATQNAILTCMTNQQPSGV